MLRDRIRRQEKIKGVDHAEGQNIGFRDGQGGCQWVRASVKGSGWAPVSKGGCQWVRVGASG